MRKFATFAANEDDVRRPSCKLTAGSAFGVQKGEDWLLSKLTPPPGGQLAGVEVQLIRASYERLRAENPQAKKGRSARLLEYTVAGYAKLGATAPCAIFKNLQLFRFRGGSSRGGVFRDPRSKRARVRLNNGGTALQFGIGQFNALEATVWLQTVDSCQLLAALPRKALLG